MTISNTVARWAYTGDGATTDFSYTNKIFATSDLAVYVDDVLQTAGYSVTGAGVESGGSVSFSTAPAAAASIVIVRDVPDLQPTDYPAGGPFPAAAHETGLDRRTVVSQQQAAKIARSLHQPDSDAEDLAALPLKAIRASRHLAFDANGDPIAAADPGSYPASAFGASLIDDADASAALTTLGVSAFAKTLVDDADAPAARNTLGLLPYLGKNALINGSFAIWQRGTSFTPAANAQVFTADRWFCNRNADADYTVARQGTAEQYSIRLQRDNGTASVQPIRMRTIIESANCTPLIGKTVQISFDAKCGADFSPTSNQITVKLTTGTGVDEGLTSFITGAWAGNTDTSETETLTTSWARYSMEVTVASDVKEIGLLISFTPTGTAGANDWAEIRNVQIEASDVANDFEHRPVPAELALCQRYYEEVGYGLTGYWSASTTVYLYGQYRNEKRVAPTLAILNTALTCTQRGTGANLTGSGSAIVGSSADVKGFEVGINGFTGATAAKPSGCITANVISVDAEL